MAVRVGACSEKVIAVFSPGTVVRIITLVLLGHFSILRWVFFVDSPVGRECPRFSHTRTSLGGFTVLTVLPH